MPRQTFMFSFPTRTPSQCNQDKHTSVALYQQLLAGPVLVVAVGQVSSYYEGNLLLAQFLGRNLKGICHALDINQNGSVSTVESLASHTIREMYWPKVYLICSALVPNTRAFSYFVM